MLNSAAMSGGPDLTMATVVIVFLSVAITAAGMGYWFLYIRKPHTPPVDGNARRTERAPLLPPPLPAVSAPVALYCPACGVQNPAGTTMCACGYNLATIKMPSFPYSPAGPAATGSTEGRRSRNGWVIFDEQSARKAAHQGMWGAFLVAIITAGVAVLAGLGFQLVNGVGSLAWIDAAVFAFLGLGIKNMNRAAAVGALVLYLIEQVALSQHIGFNPAMIAMVVCFVQGARGTFAFHRYQEESSSRTFVSGMAPPYENNPS